MNFLDRIKETSISTGTSTFTLAGAVVGYKTFSNGTYKYCIVNATETEWEVGEGIVASGVLTRTSIEASSNAGSAVNFSAGTKYVFNTVSAAYVNSLVPYTGATQSVNLGAHDLFVQGLTIGKGNNSLVNNTALGHSTLLTATTGNFNTAVGYESLRNTTTGQYNTAVGQSSLFSNTTGGQNTALGLNALLSNTTGSTNVAVGLDTLQHITTGSSNTAIGYNAGSHITGGSTPNTTATNSVFIGRDSKANADGQTNQIVIGQNAVGNGSNTATFGNTATTANYFTGSINGGSFVKSGGTSAQVLAADGSVLTAGTNITISSGTISASGGGGISGSGTAGQVTYWTGTSAVGGSSNLFWDNATGRLGIGTNAPVTKIQVRAEGAEEGVYIDRFVSISAASAPVILARRARGSAASPTALLNGDTIGVFGFRGYGATGFGAGSRAGIAALASENWTDTAQGALFGMFTTANGTDTATYKMQLFGSGNMVLQNGGTFTDAGYRLDINGTGATAGALRVTGGSSLIVGGGNTSATNALVVQNSSSVEILKVRNDKTLSVNSTDTYNGSILAGVNSSTRVALLGSFEIITTGTPSWSGVGVGVEGANRTLKFYGVAGAGINALDNSRVEFQAGGGAGWTRTSGICRNVLITDTSFAPTSGTSTYFGLELQSTINQTGGANGITRGLYVNPTLTAAADFRAIETTNGKIVFGNLPTSSAGLPTGALWNNSGVINIV